MQTCYLPIKRSRSEGAVPPGSSRQTLAPCAFLSESRMREIRTSWFDERGVKTELRATASLLDSTNLCYNSLFCNDRRGRLPPDQSPRACSRRWSGVDAYATPITRTRPPCARLSPTSLSVRTSPAGRTGSGGPSGRDRGRCGPRRSARAGHPGRATTFARS